jgi:hypothetical protein
MDTPIQTIAMIKILIPYRLLRFLLLYRGIAYRSVNTPKIPAVTSTGTGSSKPKYPAPAKHKTENPLIRFI